MITRFKHCFYSKNFFFGALKLTKNADAYKYVNTDYGIGFNSRSELSLPDSSMSKNAIIVDADMRYELICAY